MKKNRSFIHSVAAAALLLTAAGCSTPVITADFTLPPEMISDISGVDTLEINVSAALSGPVFTAGDNLIAQGILKESIAASFSRQGFYRTADFVWGDIDGADTLFGVIKSKNSRHGHARIVTDPVTPRARLDINFTAAANYTGQNVSVPTRLTTVDYVRKFRPVTVRVREGKHYREMTYHVPYSVPGVSHARIEYTASQKYILSAAGTLHVTLTDKKGQVVYKKDFNNLRFSAVCDWNGQNFNAIPGSMHLCSMLTRDAVEAIIKDISPRKETRTLKINKDGNRSGFYLLEALAFTEAIDAYEKIPAEERCFADWENLGIAYETIGYFQNAQNCYQRALEAKTKDGGAFDYDVQIAENGLARVEKMIRGQSSLRKIR